MATLPRQESNGFYKKTALRGDFPGGGSVGSVGQIADRFVVQLEQFLPGFLGRSPDDGWFVGGVCGGRATIEEAHRTEDEKQKGAGFHGGNLPEHSERKGIVEPKNAKSVVRL